MTTPTICSLPFELLTRIVSFCDMWDIANLLDALPFLKQHTVLITDHTRPPMFFGDMKGVSRVNVWPDWDSQRLVFKRVRGRKRSCTSTLRLVEITKYDMFDAWSSFIDEEGTAEWTGNGSSSWIRHFDDTTFVYLNGYNASTTSMFKLKRAVADHPKLTWFMGMPKYPTVSPSRYVDSETTIPHIRSTYNIRRLVSLSVEGIEEFSGHHLPSLRHLVVDFSRLTADVSTYQPVRGSLKDLTLPALISMVVCYRKHPPTFNNIDVMTEVEKQSPLHLSQCGEPGPHTTFELTDVSCGPGSEPTTDPDSQYWSDQDYDMEFTSRFGVLSFNGVPCQLIEKCDLARTRQLQFTVAHPSHYPALEAMKKREGSYTFLKYIVVTVCCGDWKLPFLKSVDWENLEEVQVLSLAKYVDLSEVFCEDFLVYREPYMYVGRILVHSSQTAEHGGEIVSPVALSLLEDVVQYHGIELSQRVSRKHRSEERRVVLYEHEGIGHPGRPAIIDGVLYTMWRHVRDPSMYDISA